MKQCLPGLAESRVQDKVIINPFHVQLGMFLTNKSWDLRWNIPNRYILTVIAIDTPSSAPYNHCFIALGYNVT